MKYYLFSFSWLYWCGDFYWLFVIRLWKKHLHPVRMISNQQGLCQHTNLSKLRGSQTHQFLRRNQIWYLEYFEDFSMVFGKISEPICWKLWWSPWTTNQSSLTSCLGRLHQLIRVFLSLVNAILTVRRATHPHKYPVDPVYPVDPSFQPMVFVCSLVPKN